MSSGAPAPSDRNSLSVGSNGPLLLHDVHFLEQMAHFNREKVPERQPHAKVAGVFGAFEITQDMPDSGLRDNDMQWDFWTRYPETA